MHRSSARRPSSRLRAPARAPAAAAAALALAVLVAGCESVPDPVDGGPLAGLVVDAQRESHQLRQNAQVLGRFFAQEANALEAARAKPDEAAVKHHLDQLERGQATLEAFEEVQGTLGIAIRYTEIRDQLELNAADRARLDAGAKSLVLGAKALHRHALTRFTAEDEAKRAGAETEIERDRAALKAWRADLGITARLGS